MNQASQDRGGGASDTTTVAAGSSSGTDVSLREYVQALRTDDQRFEAERDRRLSEVAVEREKALKIKETADLAALQLAREIQTYKDEKANELRAQIESERGTYVTKNDLTAVQREFNAALKPIADYVTAQQGRHEQQSESIHKTYEHSDKLMGMIAVGISIVSVIAFIIYAFAVHHP